MAKPSIDALLLAAEWLESYEDAPDEDTGTHMRAVATWLKAEAGKVAVNEAIRAKAKELNVPAAKVRKALADMKKRNA